MKSFSGRKAFTIVELVIVIAVIAILATVLVPTFGDVIQRANQSKDIQTVKNMNTALAIYSATMADELPGNSLIQDIDDVMAALAQAGFDTAKELTPVCKGHSFYWYKTTNQIVYVNEQESAFELVYPKEVQNFPAEKNDTLTNIANEAPDAPDTPDQPKDDDFYAGKTVSILGDSISTFGGVANVLNPVYPNASVKAQSDTWWQQVIDTLGMELLVDNASGGSRVLSDEYFNGNGIRNGNDAAYRDRCVSLHQGDEKPDVILVFMGTNDFSYHVTDGCSKCQALLTCPECTSRTDKNINVCETCRAASGVRSSFCNQPLGTADSVNLSNAENPTSTCEAYAIMLHKMKQAYPDAEIYCMSLLPRVEPYQGGYGYHDHGQPTEFNTELKKVAENAGATFINLEGCVDNASATWGTYFGDAVHPTAAGMDFISQAVIDGLLGKDAYHAAAWRLSNVDADVKPTLMLDGAALSAKLTASSGYKISSVKVTMGGVDITDSAYVDGTITIPEVTGNVTVTATAELDLEGGIVWSVGAINSTNGIIVDGTDWHKRIRTSYIAVSDDMVISVLGGDAEFCVFYYDSNMSFTGWNNAWLTAPFVISDSQCAYIRIMARYKPNIEKVLTADYGNNISIAASIWTVGAVHTGDGTIVGASQYPHRIYSDLIDVSEGVTVSVRGGAAFCPVFYNANGSFVCAPNNYTTETLTILPGQYSQMRLMVCDYNNRGDASKTLTVAYGENISITTGTPQIAWASGTIDIRDGVNSDNGERIRTGLFNIQSGVITVSTANNAEVNVVYYDKDMKILANQYSGWTADDWSSAQAPTGVAYVRIVARSAPATAITADYGQNISVTFQ